MAVFWWRGCPQTNTDHESMEYSMLEDVDPTETQEWLDALESLLDHEGAERAHYLMGRLAELATRDGVQLPFAVNTPYRNSIAHASVARVSGGQCMERRNRASIRRDAIAWVL